MIEVPVTVAVIVSGLALAALVLIALMATAARDARKQVAINEQWEQAARGAGMSRSHVASAYAALQTSPSILDRDALLWLMEYVIKKESREETA